MVRKLRRYPAVEDILPGVVGGENIERTSVQCSQRRGRMMFFTFVADARWNPDRVVPSGSSLRLLCLTPLVSGNSMCPTERCHPRIFEGFSGTLAVGWR